MTDVLEKRKAVLVQMASLPTDTATWRAYLELRAIEQAAHNADPPVLMCSCEDWQTCIHPWPQRYRL